MSFTELYQTFGNSWRISQSESLFDYLPGESTTFFTDPNFPTGLPAGLTDAQRNAAQAACIAAGVTDPDILSACILDVGLTGDTGYAQSAAGVQQGLNRPVQSLEFGRTLAGAISLNQEIIFPFNASSGDRLFARSRLLSSIGSAPEIRIFRPNGSVAGFNFSSITNPSLVDLDVSLNSTGTHFLQLTNESGVNYNLYLQRTNNPSNFTSVNFGTTNRGSFGSTNQSNTFTFTANAGDVIRLKLEALIDTVSPRVRLYNPDGTLIGSDFATITGPFSTGLTSTLSNNGRHTLVAGLGTGNYNFSVQRPNNPGNTIPINIGDTRSASIDNDNQIYTYVFNGTNGRQIRVIMERVTGNFSPLITLYRPDGSQLAGDDASITTPTFANFDTTLDRDGRFTLLATQVGGGGVGSFRISVTAI